MSWLERLPKTVVARFAGRATLRRTVGNSFWLLADHVFRLGVSVVVGLWIARHLGPEQFGTLNFAAAFAAPFAALLLTSLNALVVRDLVRSPDQEAAILGTTALLKLAGGLIAVLVGGVMAWTASSVDDQTFPLILVVLAGSVFTAGEVSDLWLQARSQARMSAWVRSAASLITSSGKVVLIMTDAPLLWFAAMGALELALCALGWAISFWRSRSAVGRWQCSGDIARRLLKESWPLLLGGVAMQIQAYYDQVLLSGMRDAQEVGYYAAALRLVALLGFIPMAIYTAVAPEVTHAYRAERALYARRLRDVYRAMLVAFLVVALPMVAIPDLLIAWTVGEGYAASAALLPLLSLRLLLTNLGVARSLHITNEGLFVHALITSIVATILNLVLNLMLIPVYGALGCVYAALASFTVNVLVLEWINPRARLSLVALGSALGICKLLQ